MNKGFFFFPPRNANKPIMNTKRMSSCILLLVQKPGARLSTAITLRIAATCDSCHLSIHY